jgi:hypothetical protein
MSLLLMDADGDGDIDSAEWAAGYAQLGKTAPGVPNPAVWYGTLPDGPAFRVEQISMQSMYTANAKGQMPPSQLVEKTDYRDETKKGIMVGYGGHVPRARDKVGGAPLGNLPGTPVSPNGKVGIDMEAMMSGKFKRDLPAGREKTFAQHTAGAEAGAYVSEARDQGASGGVKPKLYKAVRVCRRVLARARALVRTTRPRPIPEATAARTVHACTRCDVQRRSLHRLAPRRRCHRRRGCVPPHVLPAACASDAPALRTCLSAGLDPGLRRAHARGEVLVRLVDLCQPEAGGRRGE